MTVDFNALVGAVSVIFVYIVVGYIARKVGFIDDTASKKLSRFVLSIAQPFMIVNAILSTEYSEENLKSGMMVLVVGFTVHALEAVIAFVAVRWMKNKEERCISEVAMIFANCGFIGFPLVKALFGNIGLFWGAFYVITFNMVCWTYGLFVLSRANDKIKMNPLKILLNYGTVPCLAGLIMFLLRIRLPGFLATAVEKIGDVSTPVTLIVAGGLIATIPAKKLLTNLKVYYCNIVRLLVMPIAASIVLSLLGFSHDFVIFGSVMAGLPTGAVIAMFGETYDLKPDYAAHIVGMSTLLIIATLPAAVWIIGFII